MPLTIMSKNLNLDPVLLNINSINSSFSEKSFNLYGCYESRDSAIENDFNDNLTIDVIPQLENYKRCLSNTFKQRPTIELLHQSSFDNYLNVNQY